MAVTQDISASLAGYQEEIRRRGEDIAALRRELQSVRRRVDEAEAIADEIRRTVKYEPRVPVWINDPHTSLSDHGAPIAFLSDIHYGEVVKAAQTNEVNEYRPEIANRRVKLFTSHVAEIQREHGGKIKPPGLVLMFGGDMCSGSIVEELRMTDALTPEQTKQALTDVLASVVDNLATEFGRLFVPCVVGNHGRDTLKTHFKNSVFHNHDWGVYMNLVRVFGKEKNIKFYVPEAFDAYFTVFGHRFFLTHGDQIGVRGGDGIIGNLGPIARGVAKIRNSEAQIGRNIDTAFFAHFHNFINLQTVVVNGSVKGYDEFSRLALRAAYERPTQAMLYVHPQWGRTATFPVYLEEKKTAKTNQIWCEWAA